MTFEYAHDFHKLVGFFSEMQVSYADDGSVQNYIVEEVAYDKEKMCDYLLSQTVIATCPKYTIDCVTGEVISSHFKIMTDGEYEWCDFLAYHVKKYNISLPEGLINKVMAASGKKTDEKNE